MSDSPSVKMSTGDCSLLRFRVERFDQPISERPIPSERQTQSIMPAITLTSVLSKTNKRTIPCRSAPSAMRNAILALASRERALAASSRHCCAMSNTALTAASSVRKAGRKSPVTSSAAETSTATRCCRPFLGVALCSFVIMPALPPAPVRLKRQVSTVPSRA